MSRYIDVDLKESEIADKIQEISSNVDVFIAVRKVLQLFPTADVELVRHGHWIIAKPGNLTCSYCGKSIYIGGKHEIDTVTETIAIAKSDVYGFCSICGARMDGEAEYKMDDFLKEKIRNLIDSYKSIRLTE